MGGAADRLPPAPDLIDRVVGFRKWRVVRGYLCSPYVTLFWREPVLEARCRPDKPMRVFGQGWLRTPHEAPHPECECGIYAYHRPPPEGPIPYLDRVVGIVSLWGRMEVHADGLRAQHARVEALALRPQWGTRQVEKVERIAAELGVDLVDHRELAVAAGRYGERLPRSMVPEGRAAPRGEPRGPLSS